MLTGYRVPGSTRGQALTLPDWCHGLVGEADADAIATELRAATDNEPTWQTVRGRLIQLARSRSRTGSSIPRTWRGEQ